jgi:hypothetical protein
MVVTKFPISPPTQFEREVTSERIRDKIAASKRKGLWVGGMASGSFEAVGKMYSGGDRTHTCPATSCSALWLTALSRRVG